MLHITVGHARACKYRYITFIYSFIKLFMSIYSFLIISIYMYGRYCTYEIRVTHLYIILVGLSSNLSVC